MTKSNPLTFEFGKVENEEQINCKVMWKERNNKYWSRSQLY